MSTCQSEGVANVLDYIRLTPGPGFQPISAALYYAQRLITHGGARNVIAKVIAAAIQRQHPENGSETEPDQVAYCRQLLTTLTTEGCGILGQVLQPSSVQDIHDFLQIKIWSRTPAWRPTRWQPSSPVHICSNSRIARSF